MNAEHLTLNQAAAALGCSRSNVRRLVTRGLLIGVRVGVSRGRRVTRESLEAFIADRREHTMTEDVPIPRQRRPRHVPKLLDY